MPLLLVDLDNTLVERTGAFRGWAEKFAAEHGGMAEDAARLVEIDRDGFAAREHVAAQAIAQFGLPGVAVDDMVRELRQGILDNLALLPGALAALRGARAAGWTIACVTNGSARQQQQKIDIAGLGEVLDAIVISDVAGVRKPDPKIFQLAAEAARCDLAGAWMIGDSAEADIAGGAAAGVSTAWLHRGREWDTPGLTPTISADSFAAAVAHIMAEPISL